MFKVIPSKPYFSVSDDQQIMWNATGTVLSQYEDKDGYLRCTYRIKNKSYHVSVHRAVAEVFVPNKKPTKFNIVNHKNSDRKDNRPPNLEWTDHKGNRQHCQFTGSYDITGDKHSQCVIGSEIAEKICKMLSQGMRQCDIAKILNIKRYYIVNIKRGLAWREISEKYNLNIPKKETFSIKTLEWIQSKLDLGEDLEDIFRMNPTLNRGDKDRIKELLSLMTCND